MKDYPNLTELPYFTPQVIYDCPFLEPLIELHLMIVHEKKDLQKEELFYFLIEPLVNEYANIPYHTEIAVETKNMVENICNYMEQHYNQTINLEEFCKRVLVIKVILQFFFKKVVGMTPKQYSNIFFNQKKDEQ